MIPPPDIKSSGASDVKAIQIRHKSFEICPNGMVNAIGARRLGWRGASMFERRNVSGTAAMFGGCLRTPRRTPERCSVLDALTRPRLFGAG